MTSNKSYLAAVTSHKTDNWSTPKFIYDFFIERGAFDPCPLDDNGFGATFVEWHGDLIFVNPPYSDVSNFVDAAIVRHKRGKCIVLLIPVRTSTRWFQKLCDFGCLFWFVRGRLTFGEAKDRAPFDSMFVILNGSRLSTMKLGSAASFLGFFDDYLRFGVIDHD